MEQGGFIGVCQEVRADREVVIIAVAQDGKALQFASDIFKNDKVVVLAAVSQNGEALQFVSDRLKLTEM